MLRVEKWEGLWVGKREMVKGGKRGRIKGNGDGLGVVKREGLRVDQR